MKLIFNLDEYNLLASNALKDNEQRFCRFLNSRSSIVYKAGAKLIKAQLIIALITSEEMWRKANYKTLEPILDYARTIINIFNSSFYEDTSVYFTDQDLAILSCKLCLSVIRDMESKR